MLAISSTRQGNALVVAMDGRIDASSVKSLEERCMEWIDAGEKRLVFDFTSVGYISSAGLRVFLLIAKRLGAAEGSLCLCGMNATLRDVFEISGFSKLFSIASSVEEAL
jgi:anti-anti-sigma factor